jgi:transcriptional regulator
VNTGIPTWNYVAVHAAGIARIAHDREEKLTVLRRMFSKYESQVQHDFEAQSEKFQEGQLSAIVAVEIELDRLEGKFKLSQNLSDADQHSVARWLAESPHTSVRATGELMQQNLQEKNGNEKQNHG